MDPPLVRARLALARFRPPPFQIGEFRKTVAMTGKAVKILAEQKAESGYPA